MDTYDSMIAADLIDGIAPLGCSNSSLPAPTMRHEDVQGKAISLHGTGDAIIAALG